MAHALSDSDSDNVKVTEKDHKHACSSKTFKIVTHSLYESDSECTNDLLNDRPEVTRETKLRAASSKITSSKDGKKKKKISDLSKIKFKEWKVMIKEMEPSESLKNINVYIDKSLITDGVFEDVIKTLGTNNINYEEMVTQHPSVKWTWNKVPEDFHRKSHLALIWSYKDLLKQIRNHTLMMFFEEFMSSNSAHRVHLVLYGDRKFLRDPNLKFEAEYSLCELKLLTMISHWKFDSPSELPEFISHMTKAVACEPYRAEKEKLEFEKTFYLQGRSHSCVKIDKENNGTKRLWIQQIAAIHRLPFESAKAICKKYPTPYKLYETYNKLSSAKEKQDLLQDITIGGGGKRLGPKMSGRIALLFGNRAGDLRLSNWE